MTVLAFMYDDYYCYGIQKNFKGLYDDENEAKEQLLGSRSSNQNLELMDTDTYGFKSFRWSSKYDDKSEYIFFDEKTGLRIKKENAPSTAILKSRNWLEEKYPAYGEKKRIIEEYNTEWEVVTSQEPKENRDYDEAYKMGWWSEYEDD